MLKLNTAIKNKSRHRIKVSQQELFGKVWVQGEDPPLPLRIYENFTELFDGLKRAHGCTHGRKVPMD